MVTVTLGSRARSLLGTSVEEKLFPRGEGEGEAAAEVENDNEAEDGAEDEAEDEAEVTIFVLSVRFL